MSYLYSRDRLWFKIVSLGVAALFLFSQLVDPAFAQELKSSLSEKPFKTLKDYVASSGYTIDELTKLQSNQTSEVDWKNVVEGFQVDKKSSVIESLISKLSDKLKTYKDNIDKIIEEFKAELEALYKRGSSGSESTQATTEETTQPTQEETGQTQVEQSVPIQEPIIEEEYNNIVNSVETSNTASTQDDSSILTLTTQDGHQISYRGTKIVTITRPDGTRIDDPIFDDTGNLVQARITLIDGTIIIFEGGLIIQETTKDGKIYLYSYEKDSSGNITKTTLTYDGTQLEFDSQSQILKLTKVDGTTITYDNKQISSILVLNGKTYIYESDPNNLSTFTKVIDSDGTIYYYDSNYNVVSATRPDGTIINNIVLDSEGRIRDADIRLTDGTIIQMRDRLIQRVELAYNISLSYTYIYDTQGNISQVNILKTEFILHDTFDNLNLSYWTIDKGSADSINGELVLNSGASSYTIISGQESYQRTPIPINVQADFKLDSINTEFYFGLKGYGDAINGEGVSNPDQNQGNTLRFLGILQKDGELYVRYREGTGYRNVATGIKAEAGIYYTLNIEFSSTYSRAYLYERGGSTQEIPLYESLVADYDPYLYTYAKDGKAYIDNLDITKKTEYSFTSPIDDPYYSYLPLSYKESYQTDLDIKTIQYDSFNNLIEVVKLDGTQIHYTNNLIDQVTQADGAMTLSTYAVDEFGEILQTNVYRGDIIRSYNEDGLRFQLQTQDGTINYGSDNLPESIIKEDGTILSNLRFNLDTGEILDMDILLPDGNTKIYRDGKLVEAIIIDGSRYTYDSEGLINSYTSPDGIRINITQGYSPEGSQTLTLENIAKGETRTYVDGTLTQLTDYLNVTSNYDYDSEGRLIREVQSKGSYLLHDYTYSYTDTTYTVQDETNTIRTYDSTTGELKELTYPDGTTYLYTKMTDGTTIAQLKVDEPSVGYEDYVSGGSVIEPRPDALYTSQGTFTTNVIEVNAFQFNSVSWNEVTPVGTDIQIETRTGDTLVPDETWSDWSGPLQDSAGSEVASPPAKYIQYQITMSTEDPAISPKLIEDAATGFVTLDYVKSYETILDSASSGAKEFIELTDSNVTLSSYQDASATLLLHSDGSDSYSSMTFNGDAHLDTSNAKFGSSSIALDGNGDYASLSDSSDWAVGSGDATWDFWVYADGQQNDYSTFWSQGVTTGNSLVIRSNSTNSDNMYISFGFQNAGVSKGGFESNTTFSINEWHHVAIVKQNRDWTIYIDGVNSGSSTAIDDLGDYSGNVSIGYDLAQYNTYGPGQAWYFKGNIDEFRFTKGVARWTSDFTPPLSAYLANPYKTSGSFTTNTSEFPSGASLVSWNEVTPVGTNISVQTRTGDSYLPDGSWSDWSSPLTDSTGSSITSPEARFIQYRISLETLDPAITPTLLPDETGAFVRLNYAQGLQDTISLTSFDIRGGMKDEASTITSTISQDARPAAYIDPVNGVSTIKYINDSSSIIEYIESYDGTKIYENFPDLSLYKTLDADTIILSKIDSSGNVLETLRADGKRYTYDDNEIGDIIDAQGNIIADYIYNEIGNLEMVELVYSRDELASFVEYNTTMTYQERDLALSELEKAVQKAISDVEAQYSQGMAQAQAERNRLNSLGSGYDISQALADVAKYESDLAASRDKAYQDIENERAAKYQEILVKTEDALNDIRAWELNTLDEIIRQETFSLVDTYYREYLGRSAANLEMDSWQARALSGEVITGTILSSHLETLPEHTDRIAQVESIINSIKDSLYIYINGPPMDKSNLLASLGLSLDQAVPISQAEYIRIISYLYKQDLTFARGAADSLKVLLDSKGINISHEELASQLILTDILTGSINFESRDYEPELKISAYSMMRVASLYGLNLSGYKLTYADLLTQSSPLLAHIDGNRFIIVTEVTDASLTYIDVSQGITGETQTMTKDEFLSKWDGIVIAESSAQAATLLTESESKTISGSSLKDLSTLAIDYLIEITSIGQTVIDRVKDFLYSFLTMSDEQKSQTLSTLGLTLTQAVSLTKDAIDSIISWLSEQSLYIINCAVKALSYLFVASPSLRGTDLSPEALAKGEGAEAISSELAVKAILIDILTGALTQSTQGALELSMYSIQKAAQLEGLNLTAAKVSFDFLNELTEPFIASLDLDLDNIPDHYVLITKITSTDITYIDQDGKTYSISTDNFKSKFTGYILSPEETKLQDKSLSEYLLMNIRGGKKDGGGGGLWGWIGLILAVVVLPFAPAILGGIGAAFTSIAGAIPALGGIGTAISGVISGVGTAISGIGSFLGSIGSALPFNPFQASTVLAEKGLGVALVNTITNAAINYGVSTGMSALGEAVGIDPAITNIASGLISGFASGGTTFTQDALQFSIENGIKTALMMGATSAIKELGNEIGLDPILSNLIGTAASSLIGAGMDGVKVPMYDTSSGQIIGYYTLTGTDALTYTFNNSIFPNAVGELAYYGIQELGETLGIDSQITSIGGMILRSGLQAGFGSGWDPDAMWDALVEELTKPTNLAVAFSLVGEAIGLDPLINNIMVSTVVSALEGFIEHPGDGILGMFKGMLDNFINSSIRALSFGLYDPAQGGWNRDWQADYYAMHLIDFINVVQELGIEAAIENYMSNIFRDEAIRTITQRGGIRDFLTGDAEMVEENGEWLKRINISDVDKLYLDPNTDDIVGRDYGNIKERGQYGVNPYTGGFGLINGTLEETSENGTRMLYNVTDSLIIDKMKIYGTDGGYIQIFAKNPEIGLELNPDGIPLGGIVADFDSGMVYKYEYIGSELNFELNFNDPNIKVTDVVGTNLSNLTDKQKEDIITYYLVMNGIGNQNPYNSPGYMINFTENLANADPLNENITLIPLYNDAAPIVTLNDLSKVVDNPEYLYADLGYYGYIDENGKLQKAFYDLKDSSEMDFSHPEFWDKRNEIYNFLVELNRSFFDNLGDVARNVLEWSLKTEEIANKILNDMINRYGPNLPSDMTSVSYSGSGDPFIYLLNNNHNIDVNSIVLVGTPIKKDRYIENDNVQTVVNIFGENDLVYISTNTTFRQNTDFDGYHLFENNPLKINEFAVELKGLEHTDYFYDPYYPSAKDAIKQKASRFIAEISYRSKDKDRLQSFLLQTQGISYDSSKDKYIVDLEKVAY